MYVIELSQAERYELTAMLGGKHAVRKLKRAQILLTAAARVARSRRLPKRSVRGCSAWSRFPRHRTARKHRRSCSVVEGGIILIKLWLEVGMDEQERRFRARLDDPLRQWKLSPMDIECYRRCMPIHALAT
jgi:hypothetical protein